LGKPEETDKEYKNKKPIKARISRSIDGKENVEMVRTRSKDGVGKKTKIGTGGTTFYALTLALYTVNCTIKSYYFLV
jgi:hypothetical protein